MYYIEDQDPILVKQEVVLDRERLEKLCQEIMLKFGRYVHRSYDSMFGPYYLKATLGDDVRLIRNYSETPLGDARLEENSAAVRHFEYDEYLAPELSELIRKLLEGDVMVIDKLRQGPGHEGVHSGEESGQRLLHKQLQELLESSPADMDMQRFGQLTDRIKRYYQDADREEEWGEMKEYYGKVMACVSFRSVKTLYKDKWNELRRVYCDVKEFYEGTDQFEIQLKNMTGRNNNA